MVSNLSDLTPQQLSVFEVFRRLHDAKLPHPTIDTLAQLTSLKSPTVTVMCEQLVELGYLERGGRSKVSFKISETLDLPDQPTHDPAGKHVDLTA